MTPEMNYYAHPRVRARMAEFLAIGQPAGDATSALFMIGDAYYTDYRNVQKMNALPLGPEKDFEVELAERVDSFIPDCSAGMERLISSYTASPLAKFHCEFYSAEPDPPDTWPQTYDRTDLSRLPPCARLFFPRAS